jgi:hypothetical protein
MNLETRPRGRPRNRWQDDVRENGITVGGEEWQEKVYDREEWKKLLRTVRKCSILHVPMEWRIKCLLPYTVNVHVTRTLYHINNQ